MLTMSPRLWESLKEARSSLGAYKSAWGTHIIGRWGSTLLEWRTHYELNWRNLKNLNELYLTDDIIQTGEGWMLKMESVEENEMQ